MQIIQGGNAAMMQLTAWPGGHLGTPMDNPTLLHAHTVPTFYQATSPELALTSYGTHPKLGMQKTQN